MEMTINKPVQQLIIVNGPSGSGKTLIINHFRNTFVSFSEYHPSNNEIISEQIRKGKNVIIETRTGFSEHFINAVKTVYPHVQIHCLNVETRSLSNPNLRKAWLEGSWNLQMDEDKGCEK